MNTIPLVEVRQMWTRLSGASEAQARAVAERMQREQPFLMVYLLASEENLAEGEEPGWLLLLGGLVFEVMSAQNRPLRQVNPDEIDAAEAANIKFLENLDEGPELAHLGAAEKLFKTYNQMPLLGAVLEVLMEGNEEEPELAPENTGMALLHLKTVIDCLDQ